MGSISNGVLFITPNGAYIGGSFDSLSLTTLTATNVLTNNLNPKNVETVNAVNMAINTSVHGNQLNVANGLVQLDADAYIPVELVPPVVRAGLNVKASCRLSTVSLLPAYTVVDPLGAHILQANVNGQIADIDGVLPMLDDRIVVSQYGSYSNVDNGIYVVTDVGDITHPWTMQRADDANQTDFMRTGTYTLVTSGQLSSNSGFIISTPEPWFLNIDPFEWSLFAKGLSGLTELSNAAVGIGVLSNKPVHSTNVSALGYLSQSIVDYGTNNSSLGAYTLQSIIDGDGNTAIGAYSMGDVGTTVSQQTAVGVSSLRNATNSASANTAVGYESCINLTSGQQCSTFGFQSGSAITTASQITAIGANSLVNTTGNSNTSCGANTALTLTSGTSNTIIGANANVTSAIAIEQTSLGSLAMPAGDYSVQLGRATISGPASGTLRFRTQTISNEAWIDGATAPAIIDSGGNIAKGDSANNQTFADNDSPVQSINITTYVVFITTIQAAAGPTAYAKMPNGLYDGQHIDLVAIDFAIPLNLDVSTATVLSNVDGTAVNTLRFENTGNSITLLWSQAANKWFVKSAGVAVL